MPGRTSKTASPLQEIDRLIAAKDQASAARLAELANDRDKAVSKGARRGLYLLKQAGIEPPAAQPAASAPLASAPPVATEAYISNPDGNGSQMLLFVQEDPWGGSPWLVTFLVNYAAGLKDLGASKLSRREINESLEEMRSRPGRLCAEAPVDYARWLLQEAVKINREESLPIPQGYAEDLKRVGLPEKAYDRPLIYERLDAETVKSDQSISHDPDRLFDNELFKSWLINLRVITPWVEKYAEAFNTQLALDEAQLKQRGDKVIDEAADELLANSGHSIYRRLLEEAALALSLSGDDETAKQALYQALSVSAEQPPHENPFLRALTARSVFILIALYAREQEEIERQQGGSRVVPTESASLIERA